MQVKTRVKAEGIIDQHNTRLVRVKKSTQGLKVKTRIRAGLGAVEEWKIVNPSM